MDVDASTAARARVQRSALRSLLRLPESVLRRIAGPPVVLDGQTLDLETQVVLRVMERLPDPPVESVPIPVGRKLLDASSVTVGGDLPIGGTTDLDLDGVPGRQYVPERLAGDAARPTLVFLHGGGYIYGGLPSHDAVCRMLAEQAGVQVIAVDYRLAPEHPFPAGYDDAVVAFRHVVEHAAALGVDLERLGVGGDSAGGNLSAGVAIEAAHRGWPLALQVLIYPATDGLGRSQSRRTFAEGFFLTEAFMDLATDSYVPDPVERADPRVSPLFADLPSGLAPAQVITAGFDPLRDEGEAYAFHLIDAGVPTDLRRYPSLIHGFVNWVGVGSSSRGAAYEIADRIGLALR